MENIVKILNNNTIKCGIIYCRYKELLDNIKIKIFDKSVKRGGKKWIFYYYYY